MFEYINPGFYILSGIVILISLLSLTLDALRAESEAQKLYLVAVNLKYLSTK